MFKIAEVLVNIAVANLNKTFSYIIPDHLDVEIGFRVLVPFGNRKVEGFVLSVTSGEGADLKAILDTIDEMAWFDENMVKTAKWLSEYYLCTLADAMRLFLIGKSGIKSKKIYTLNDVQFFAADSQVNSVVSFIKKHGSASDSMLKREFGDVGGVIKKLIKSNLLKVENKVYKKTKALYKNVVTLALSPEIIKTMANKFEHKPAQQRVIQLLIDQKELYPEDLKKHQISSDTIHRLSTAGIVTRQKVRVMRDTYQELQRSSQSEVRLTGQQQQALHLINEAISSRQFASFLLHGITGSGKTQVYMEAVAAVRKENRQAIVLVPEIALTSQIVSRFKARFGNDVVVIHSRLSAGERQDAWQRLRTQDAGIVIGARSAIFAPVKELGIIIIDEEHEFTYKQEENPRYHTRDVAFHRAKLALAPVLLGSATPAVESYQQALVGKHKLLTMHERADGAALPTVKVADMRQELKDGNRSVLSRSLQSLLQRTIEAHEQAIILLNRRGYSTFVICRECGHVLKCAHCAVSLVYHSEGDLRCHYCQAAVKTPDICPSCGSRYIRYFGTGTQKVEQELAKLLPQASVIRMDQDTTGKKMSHDRILAAFAKGEYDILLGTQMVAKGHDIKNVTAVGIISADTGLNMPDFRASERTFALLTQAAGRAGRGHIPGHVVIQTYNPEHYAIEAAVLHDYQNFFKQEIAAREELFYPPFSSLIKLTVQNYNDTQALNQAQRLIMELKRCLADERETMIIGPFPAAVSKIKDIFRVNILIKTTQAAIVKCKIQQLVYQADVIVDVDPLNVI